MSKPTFSRSTLEDCGPHDFLTPGSSYLYGIFYRFTYLQHLPRHLQALHLMDREHSLILTSHGRIASVQRVIRPPRSGLRLQTVFSAMSIIRQ